MNIDDRLVEAWIQKSPSGDFSAGNQIYAELDKIVEEVGHPKICEAIRLVGIHLGTLKDFSKTLDVVNAIPLDNASSVQLYFLYLFWSICDVEHGRVEEGRIMLDKLKGLLDSNIPLALKADYYFCKAKTLEGKKAIQLYLKVFSMLKKDTGQYRRNAVGVLFNFSANGKLIEFGEFSFDGTIKRYKDHMLFVNAVVNGQVSIAKKCQRTKLNPEDKLESILDNFTNPHELILDLYADEETSIIGEENLGILSLRALKKGDLKASLNYAVKYEKKYYEFQSSIYFDYCVLRVELCNRNVDAASLIISRWNEIIDSWYISDFFRARLELLKNCPEKAVEYFSNVWKLCQQYNAQGRLDFEIDLAHELKSSQVRLLTEGALKKSKKKKVVNRETVKKDFGVDLLKGSSMSVDGIREDIKKYANLNTPILILGETGVGKDVIANAIHFESDRRDQPFIAINCGAIAENLLQSELFGYQAGAYTGASKNHKGIFQEAGEGTVFLDEIGDISPGLQGALLRVLESGEYRPVGSAKPRKIQCQIVAATNVMLDSKVANGSFRKDLLYRLKRLVINMPSLKERPNDVLFLSEYFLNNGRASTGKAEFSSKLTEALLAYAWPGNVRELRNEIEKMRMLNSDKLFYQLEDADFLVPKEKKKVVEEKGITSLPTAEIKALPGIKHKKRDKEFALEVIDNNDSLFRRIETIKGLFLEHKQLTRKEIGIITGSHNRTITRDLKKLIEEKFVEKVEPTKSPRTHYFKITDVGMQKKTW